MTHPPAPRTHPVTSSQRPPFTRRDGLAILSLVLLAVIFFWRLALTELIIGRGDVFFYFYPYRDYASAAVRAGRIPLWNPFLFMGVPFLANSQAGFFYPPNLLLAGLAVERMVNVTLVLHAALAATGAYFWGRRGLGLGRAGAWLAGLCFGLGGYFTAQVEHVNQVQVLAWLPWALCLYEGARDEVQARRGTLRQSPQSLAFTLLLGGVIGLSFLAGHTQSVFISLVGLAGYAWLAPLAKTLPRRMAWPSIRPVAVVLAATVLGVGLGAVQLLPTLELSQLSVRSGGLPYNEAVSFSLNPAFLGRALLPGWDETLFPEFVAHVGVAALALGLIGLLSIYRSARQGASMSHLGVLFLTGLGLFLALGGYNPVYFLLVKLVPGFALFRAPARWLALYGLGMAGLVGLGFDWLSRLGRAALSDRGWLVLPGGAGLLALGVLVGELAVPGGDGGTTPSTGASTLALNPALSRTSVLGWLAAAGTVAMMLFGVARGGRRRWLEWLWLSLVTLELFGASTHLPFNRATAPGALTSLRPAVAHLLAEARATQADRPDPPARFLSISDVFFEPGDKPEIEIALGDQLSDQALYDYLVATKQKEVLIPNLPLYYRLPTADGYDGGVLPLRRYVTLERLFMPEENVAIDGRLRENLDSVPAGRWLSLFNVRYVVTDKSGDAWFDGVFYDLQHQAALGPGDEAQVGYVPDFAATALGVVYQAPGTLAGTPLAEFELIYQDGASDRLPLSAGREGSRGGDQVARLSWGKSRRLALIEVRGLDRVVIRGLSLVDERTDTFQALVLSASGHYRLVHSGDVKIYENLDVLPRAFFVNRALFVPDDEAALAAMRAPDFDPSTTVVLGQSAWSPLTPRLPNSEPKALVTFVLYEPERVVLDITTPDDGWLVLTDAWYPGWQARVDGEPARIERANILFRAVAVAGGRHWVEFVYRPDSFRWGGSFSLGVVVTMVLGGVALGWKILPRRK